MVAVTWDSRKYNLPYKRSMSVLTNVASLSGVAPKCDKNHAHEPLRGTMRISNGLRINRASPASVFSSSLCHVWARCLAEVALVGSLGPLSEEADTWVRDGLDLGRRDGASL